MPETTIERLARVLCDTEGYEQTPNNIESFSDSVRAILQELREPSEGMSMEGLTEAARQADERRQWWNDAKRQAGLQQEQAEVGYPIMPTSALLSISSKDTDAILKAMIDHILNEHSEGK